MILEWIGAVVGIGLLGSLIFMGSYEMTKENGDPWYYAFVYLFVLLVTAVIIMVGIKCAVDLQWHYFEG